MMDSGSMATGKCTALHNARVLGQLNHKMCRNSSTTGSMLMSSDHVPAPVPKAMHWVKMLHCSCHFVLAGNLICPAWLE